MEGVQEESLIEVLRRDVAGRGFQCTRNVPMLSCPVSPIDELPPEDDESKRGHVLETRELLLRLVLLNICQSNGEDVGHQVHKSAHILRKEQEVLVGDRSGKSTVHGGWRVSSLEIAETFFVENIDSVGVVGCDFDR